MLRRSVGLWAVGLLAASVLVACPALQGTTLKTDVASLGASSWQGPLKTRVVKTEILDRFDGSPAWMRIEAEVEVIDATGAKVKGIKQDFFRLLLAPLPEVSKGALPVVIATPTVYGGIAGGGSQSGAIMVEPAPAQAQTPGPGGASKYRVQVGAADMQRVPSFTGEIYQFTEAEAGKYVIRATFKLISSSGSYMAPPAAWVPSIAAFVSDDTEAGKVDNFYPQGAGPGGIVVDYGGRVPGPVPYATPAPMASYGGDYKGGYPIAAPTFGGFPQDAKLTGRFFTNYGPVPVVAYQTLDGTRSTVVAVPNYAGYFYFAKVEAGQYQVVYDVELQNRFGYVPSQTSPAPDMPIPSPSPSPSTGATVAPMVRPDGSPAYSPMGPKLVVTEPVMVPAANLSAPQVEINPLAIPSFGGINLIQTSTDRFANFVVVLGGYGSGPYYMGTPQPAPKLEYQAQILNASGDILVGTATTSSSPIFWNLRDASGSLLPAGSYQVQLKFWKAGGRFGGPNYHGINYPQPLTI